VCRTTVVLLNGGGVGIAVFSSRVYLLKANLFNEAVLIYYKQLQHAVLILL
jgi:hypothetical protein